MKRILGKGKAKGTVLFTVITVMLVMVVLLMTTLTLTSAAQRRSYYTYFESQAQYAAQAAIDAISYGAYQDDSFHDFVLGAPLAEDVTDTNPAPEIQVRFDGSSIPFTGNNPVVRCTIERLPEDAKWDEATSALHPREMWRITATAHVGNGRNEATYSISQYLYENFQAPAESLAIAPSNSAEYSLFSYDTIPGSHDDDEVVVSPLSTSPGVVFFGNQGFSNNMVTLGPAYNNLATLPLGRGNYEFEDFSTRYNVNAYNKDNFTADPYDIMMTNANMRTVGDVIFVNNLYDRVVWNMDFQSPKEGVVIYGNFGIDNNGLYVNPKVNSFTLDAEGRRWYEDNCNYFYVDGKIEGVGTCNVQIGSDAATNPVNLYCGGIGMDNVNYKFAVYGDVYMYDPDIESAWSGSSDTPLNAWAGMEITKTSGSAANTVGGNIICNNKSLTIGGPNGTFNVPGDIIMTNPQSTLTMRGNVRVGGKVVSAGRVTSETGAVVTGGIVQGADAYTGYSRPEYGTDYISAQGGGNYDYRLMPFEHRIDEIFERYYRWDLKSTNVDDMTTAINNDQLIRESISAGHEWTYDSFDAPEYGGTVYVPCTTPKLENRFVIKKHRHVNPSDAIGKLVENNMTNYIHYTGEDGFVGEEGLPAFTGTTKEQVQVVSHDHLGAIQYDNIPDALYVIKSSCEIDLNNEAYGNAAGFFIDPSDLRGNEIIKIGLKGTTKRDAQPFYFVVNNTADYGDDYTDPDPYCEQETIKCANRIQVQIFWDESFGGRSASPYFMTSGAWHQMNEEKVLSVVQNPDFPTEDDNLSGLSAEVRYAYELIPNFTLFGEAGAVYDFSNTSGNGAKFNADVAMPLSGIRFGTVNSGTYTVTYRERPSSQASTGESYLWSISSIMIDSLKYNDDYAMSAYVGGVGYSGGNTPDIETTERSGGNSSAKIGDNKNSWFKKDYISD